MQPQDAGNIPWTAWAKQLVAAWQAPRAPPPVCIHIWATWLKANGPLQAAWLRLQSQHNTYSSKQPSKIHT